jgi:hypothetical protein
MLFKIESYGYTMTDLIYDWQTGKKSVEVRFLSTERRKAERERRGRSYSCYLGGDSKSSLPKGEIHRGISRSFSASFRQLFPQILL